MIKKVQCKIQSPPFLYSIDIEDGLLSDMERIQQILRPFGSRFAFIADETTAALFGEEIVRSLSKYGMNAPLFTFPSGEENKTRKTKEILENCLLENKFGKDSCIVALGGGVTTDIAGFVAATYCRGVSLVMIPTSLLAMVDASIGGKTGVNVPAGKNLIGCIYQPRKVLIDPGVLKSLPVRELRNGIVEMIKHGLIADAAYFEFLEKKYDGLLALDSETMQNAIQISCQIKKKIVEEDERESGKRRLLNFGHTVGHAIETLTRYAIPHGEAVALGMVVEGHTAMQLGELDIFHFERIRNVLNLYGLPLKMPQSINADSILEAMGMDKKSEAGKPRFVLLKEIGAPLPCQGQYCTHVDEKIILSSLDYVLRKK